MPKYEIDKDGNLTTDSTILVKFKFDCECGFEGTISYQGPKIDELTVKENLNFNDPNGPIKCPNCSRDIVVPGGRFVLNKETGEMVRMEE